MSYIALFLTPELFVIGSKKFKPTDTFINFKKGTFNIRLDAFLYRNKDSAIFAYIYPTDERLLIDVSIVKGVKKEKVIPQEPIKKNDNILIESARLVKIKEKIEHGDLHLLVAESIIGQLARAFIGAVKTNWVLIILALGAGVAVGYIACSAMTPHITTYINSTINSTPLPTTIKSVP
jgi:hypothetical protein